MGKIVVDEFRDGRSLGDVRTFDLQTFPQLTVWTSWKACVSLTVYQFEV